MTADVLLSIGISSVEAKAGRDQIVAYNDDMAASYGKLIALAKDFGGTMGAAEQPLTRVRAASSAFWSDTQAGSAKLMKLNAAVADFASAMTSGETATKRITAASSPFWSETQAGAGKIMKATQAVDAYTQSLNAVANAQQRAADRAEAWYAAIQAEGLRNAAAAAEKFQAQQSSAALITEKLKTAQIGAATATNSHAASQANLSGMAKLSASQMMNLSYQINDVVSGLAMGQSPMMILTQQGGQFVQIFQQAGISLSRIGMYAAGITALVAPFALVTSHVITMSSELRSLNVALAASGMSAGMTAAGLRGMAQELAETGPFSRSDAVAAIKELTKYREIRGDMMREMADLGKDFAAATGTDLATGTRKLADAVTGSFDSFKKLSDQYGLLGPKELEHIKNLMEQGRRHEAMRLEIAALEGRFKGLAEAGMSPAAQASHNLGVAYDEMIEKVSNSDFVQKAATNWGNWLKVISANISGGQDAANAEVYRLAAMENLADTPSTRRALAARNSGAALFPAAAGSAGVSSAPAAAASSAARVNDVTAESNAVAALVKTYTALDDQVDSLTNTEKRLNSAVRDGIATYDDVGVALNRIRLKRAEVTNQAIAEQMASDNYEQKSISERYGLLAKYYDWWKSKASGNLEEIAKADQWYASQKAALDTSTTKTQTDNQGKVSDAAARAGQSVAANMTSGYNAAASASTQAANTQISNFNSVVAAAQSAAQKLRDSIGAAAIYNNTTSASQDVALTVADNKAARLAEAQARASTMDSSFAASYLADVQREVASYNAKGNIFSVGNVVPFALGGLPSGQDIFSTPTYFPMAGGKVGLTGENGTTDALMPVTRDSKGRLAVTAVGGDGGGATINITVPIAPGAVVVSGADSPQRTAEEIARHIAPYIGRELERYQRTSGDRRVVMQGAGRV